MTLSERVWRGCLAVAATLLLCTIVSQLKNGDRPNFDLSQNPPLRTILKEYVPSSWMSASDAAASPLLHRVANTQSFQDATHDADAGSAATPPATLQTSAKTEQLASAPAKPAPPADAKPADVRHSAALRRLTTKAEKLGEHLHVYGQQPSKSQWRALVHAAEAYATQLAAKHPRDILGAHWRWQTQPATDTPAAIRAAAAAADKAAALQRKQKEELREAHLRDIGEYAPPNVLHALLTAKPAAKP
eukprot:CAMPEP_0172193928 /NCGR_PEP_ID=MMETSP1050-20130122/25263_1 /TAXON_ID=233186 /ORGANISM="Cryptomonas curvata, Strain CCAP979/52" /LENGTH=245 /DNA_ID=CAMNT_0012869611 /DNA_START=524 /DNA_END=1257 /DNA_ORIENTATION=-